MKIWRKRICSGLLAAALLVPDLTPVVVTSAEEHTGATEMTVMVEASFPGEESALAPEITETETVIIQIIPESDLPDNGDLFAAFAERELYGYEAATFGIAARAGLNEAEREIYDVLKAQIETVALNGGSTVFPLSGLNGVQTAWTNTELGVSSIENMSMVRDAFVAQFSLTDVVNALLKDCPFDLYWFDKTVGAKMAYSINRKGYTQAGETVWNTAQITNLQVTFAVSVDYNGGSDTVTSDVTKVTAAKDNAAMLVAANASKSDADKLQAYREYICNAVSYNHAAADDNSTPYGDPWQLIYVFDADSSTNVVCEGYAKAFQYLCDLGGMDCISVNGTLTGSSGSEGHMWNVVTLDSQKYMVDITNCDTGMAGAPDLLFLVGAPYADGGYSFRCGSQTLRYTCSDQGLAETNYDGSAQLPYEFVDGDFAFYIADGQASLTAYTGAAAEVTIPETVDGVPVRTIGAHAFEGNTNLEKITIAANIVTIEDGVRNDFPVSYAGAFVDCTNLKTVVIPAASQLAKIGEWSFVNCTKLSDITLPPSIRTLGLGCFLYCASLENVVLPEGLETLSQNVFEASGVKTLHIPSTCTFVSSYQHASKLESITVAEGNPYYRSHEGVLYDNQRTSGWTLVLYPKSKPEESYRVPDYCTHIDGDVFVMEAMPAYLKTLYIGDTDTVENGMGYNSLTRIECNVVPDDTNAHYTHDNGMLLTKDGKTLVQVARTYTDTVNIPAGVEKLEGYLFWYGDLKQITIPDSVKEFGDSVFGFCENLEAVYFEGDMPAFEGWPFYCITTTVYYPENNETWSSEARANVPLYEGTINWVAVSDTVASGTCGTDLTWKFDESTKTLTISGNGEMPDYTSADDALLPWASFGSSVEEIVIENGVTRIGDYAFAGCSGAKKISIPQSVTQVGQTVVAYGTEVESVINQTARQWSEVQNDTPYFPNWEFTSFVNQAPVTASGIYGAAVYWELDENGDMVFFGSGDMYDMGAVPTPWGDLAVKTITIGEGITRIGHCAFEVSETSVFSQSLLSVHIPSTVVSVGGLAFSGCKSLETITFAGDAPYFDGTSFDNVSAVCRYPGENETWSGIGPESFGENITWTVYCVGEHNWNDATCLAPRTCSVCKETEGKPLSHTYDDNVDGNCNVCSVNRETVETRKVTHMFRMYNPNTGEHFYTGSEVEKSNLVAVGWQYEGVGFTFPANTGAPVYRLFQPSTGEHLYTMNEAEKAKLESEGWNYEGIAFNSAYDTEAVQHRLHNPNATVGAYHFTFSEEERQNLISVGWEYQGIGWYSCWK